MKRKIAALIIMFMVVLNVDNIAYAKNYHEADVENYIMEQMSASKIPGMSISIVTSGREIYSAAFGEVSETASDMEIGELSKNFTALAVMQLVESGKLDLSKRAVEYISDYSQLGDITVKDLVDQTSGISGEQYIDEISIGSKRGTYSNANGNYNLLEKIIENVSGKSYSEYMSENIFEPLNMKSTCTISLQNAGISGFVEGNSNYFGLPVKNKTGISEPDGWIEAASSGIISNVKDIGNYLKMYLNAGGKILSYDGVKEMLSYKGSVSSGKSIFDTGCTYGMGWQRTQVDKQAVYYCSGAIAGYTSAMFIIPSQDVGVTILCNSSDVISGNKLTEQMQAGVVHLVMGQKAKTIDAKKYLIPHIELDFIYLFIVLFAFMPLFTIGIWYRFTKNRRGIILKSMIDAVIHLVIPTLALIFIPRYTCSWSMLKRFIPDAYYVCMGSTVLLYVEVIIKVIIGVIVKKHDFIEDEDSEGDYEDIDTAEDENNIEKDNDSTEASDNDITNENSDETNFDSDVLEGDISEEAAMEENSEDKETGKKYKHPKKIILEPPKDGDTDE